MVLCCTMKGSPQGGGISGQGVFSCRGHTSERQTEAIAIACDVLGVFWTTLTNNSKEVGLDTLSAQARLYIYTYTQTYVHYRLLLFFRR